jgi:hypothetical protein
LSILFVGAMSFAQGKPQSGPPPYPAQPPPPGAYPQAAAPTPYPYYQQAPPGTYQEAAPGGYAGYAPPPPILKYQEGARAPAGYHLEERPRKGLVVAGSVVLGTTYFLSAAIGMASRNTDDRWLLVPVFGPFLDLGARGNNGCTGTATAACDALDAVVRFYLALDGVVQGAGALLLVSGFVFPKKEFVSDSYYGASGKGPGIAWWTVSPDVTSSRYGLTLRGALF